MFKRVMQILTARCSLRRVKCDETKPACLNCAGNGRTCAGYRTPQEVKVSQDGAYRHFKPKHEQIPEFTSCVVTLAKPCYWVLRDSHPDDGVALSFFRQHTARELRGC
jgi:hypothetical protein